VVDAVLHAACNSVSKGLEQFEGFCFEDAVGLFIAAVLSEGVELLRRLFEFLSFFVIGLDEGEEDHMHEFGDLGVGELFAV